MADPGAQVAQKAQEMNYPVRPLVGPCSMILALMASGMDGQNFRFSGYLPIKEPERSRAIKELDKISTLGSGETQLFIETPYRNNQMLKDLLTFCSLQTRVLVAMDITGPEEFIKTRTVEQWKKENPELPKLPSIFGILGPQKRTGRSR
ncbi:SAM-dependent methyltransferase [Turicimonas muris]|uniref:SAM-dependent methyltransferase n=1 Tax=Turicimonas muris TaxID=1796652 RepID=UPI0030B958DC